MWQSWTNGHVLYAIAFPIDNRNIEFQTHVTAVEQAHDKSLFTSVTGRAMWRTLHQAAAGQPAHRLLFHCEYHRLQRCRAALVPPANATYHLCPCHFPGNWGEGSMVPRYQSQTAATRGQLPAKIWCQPHCADNTDHGERPVVGLMRVKLSTSQRRKLG